MVVEMGGTRLLIDPVLGDVGSFESYGDIPGNTARNPIVPLGIPVDELLDVDAVIVTHMHRDHFDQAAQDLIPEDMPMVVQNGNDKEFLTDAGYTDVRILPSIYGDESGCKSEPLRIGDIELMKTPGKHGDNDYLAELAGEVCGFVAVAPDEPRLYMAGDTVWYEGVRDVLERFSPEVVVVNAGGNRDIKGRLIMHDVDVLHLHQALPSAKIVAVHMEDINHYTVTREELRLFAEAHGFSDDIAIPENGETVVLGE